MNLILDNIINKIMQFKAEGHNQYVLDVSKLDDPYHIVKSLTDKGFNIDFDNYPKLNIKLK